MRLMKSLLFDAHSIKALREKASNYWWIYLLLASIIFAIPLTAEEVATTHIEIVKMLGTFLAFTLASYGFSKVLNSRTSFNTYFHPLSRIILAGSILAALLAFISLFVFEYWLDVAAVSNLITSIIPFYLVVLYGFSAEQLSLLEGTKGTTMGMVSVILLAGLFFFI